MDSMEQSTLTSRLGTGAARLVSLLFHPLTMAVWMTLLVMYGFASPMKFPDVLRRFVISNVVVITIFIPLIFNLLLRLFGVVKRDATGGRKVAIMRLVIAALCYVCCGFMFAEVPLLFLLRKMLFLGSIVLLVALVTEFCYPISHHTLAFGTLLGYMWVLLFVGNMGLLYPFVVALVLGGLLVTSRLHLSELAPVRIYVALLGGVLIAVMCAIFV